MIGSSLSWLALASLAQTPASFHNIKIADTGPGFQPCEPSIAVSQKDPNVIVAGVILDRAIFTKDAGKTWNDTRLTSPFGVFGDPTLISDSQGNFYYFHLSSGKTSDSWLDRIVCQKSTNGGLTWSDGVGIGLNPPTDQDKQWATAHPSKPTLAVTWTQFDKYDSKDPLMHSNIMFSTSTDAGATWSKALRINDISGDCLDDDGTTEGAVPAIDKNGHVYVTWGNQGVIWFDRSLDGGKTWMKHDYAVAKQYGGWNMDIPGINRSNGMPILVVDNSPSPRNGNLYLVWADQRGGAADTDIFFCSSSDQGETWTEPLRINKDAPGKQQFLPWLTIDQTTGYLYVVYYDRRAYDDLRTDLYVATSVDGGKTFIESKVSESPFTPSPNTFFGDYNNISANKGIIAPIWTRLDNGKTSVWTAVIKHADLMKGK